MVGVPWAMAFVEEQQIMEMERTERAREVAGEVCGFFPFFLSFLFFFLAGELGILSGEGVQEVLWGFSLYALRGPSLDVVLEGFSQTDTVAGFASLRYEC